MRIDERCDQTWDAMRPVGEGRHCERCDHAVVDLTRATRAQAEALLRTRDRVCVRARVHESGELRFQPPPPSRARRFVGGLVLAAGLQACATGPSEPEAVQVVNEAPLDPRPMPPPMRPAAARPPAPPTRPVPASQLQLAVAEAPTAVQRRLTARKQARDAQLTPPPQVPMALGMMVGPSHY